MRRDFKFLGLVALRKESVDRNFMSAYDVLAVSVSLSARRAWIEIPALLGNPQNDGVALRKESVDRNFIHNLNLPSRPSRSPQGERG